MRGITAVSSTVSSSVIRTTMFGELWRVAAADVVAGPWRYRDQLTPTTAATAARAN